MSLPACGSCCSTSIKATHYDDDGYPIQLFRSAIPSNTLACLNALAEDARGRNVLGPDVEIRLHTYDETNRRVQPDRIIREIRKAGGKALIGLVGVQSNQFPRAVDLGVLPGHRGKCASEARKWPDRYPQLGASTIVRKCR